MGAQMTDLGFDFRSGSTEITFEYHKHTQKWVLERPSFYKTCYASSCTEETYDTEIRSLTEPIINPWKTQSIWIKNHVKKSFQRPWVGSSGQNSSIWNHRILSQICPWQKFDLSDQGDLRFMKTFFDMVLINKMPNSEGNIDRTSQSSYLAVTTLPETLHVFEKSACYKT